MVFLCFRVGLHRRAVEPIGVGFGGSPDAADLAIFGAEIGKFVEASRYGRVFFAVIADPDFDRVAQLLWGGCPRTVRNMPSVSGSLRYRRAAP